jgi:hypothetical protein
MGKKEVNKIMVYAPTSLKGSYAKYALKILDKII